MSSAGRSRRTTTCPRSGLPACTAPNQAGCILSWQSFAEPADPDRCSTAYHGTTGLAGGGARATAPAVHQPAHRDARRRGAAGRPISARWCPSAGSASAQRSERRLVAARCDGRGFLLIGGADPAARAAMCCRATITTSTIMPCSGRTIRADAARRLAAFGPMITAGPPSSATRCPTAGGSSGSMSAPRRSALAICDAGWRIATPAEMIRAPSSPPTSSALQRFVGQAPSGHRGRPAAQPRRQRSPAHPVGPRLRPQSGAARPADPALGRALVDPGGDRTLIDADVQPRPPRRTGRQMAAAYILQGAIDALANLPSVSSGDALVDLISIDSLSDREIDAILAAPSSGSRTIARSAKRTPAGELIVQPVLRELDPHPDVVRDREPPAWRFGTPFRLNIVVKKGETVDDTARTLNAMQPDALVIRHRGQWRSADRRRDHRRAGHQRGDGTKRTSDPGAARCRDDYCTASAGSKGLKVAICGDIRHSRGRPLECQNFWRGWAPTFGSLGRRSCCPRRAGDDDRRSYRGADVVMMLRVQRERLE